MCSGPAAMPSAASKLLLALLLALPRAPQVCYCAQCQARADKEGLRRVVVSPSEFERHAGALRQLRMHVLLRPPTENPICRLALAACKRRSVANSST